MVFRTIWVAALALGCASPPEDGTPEHASAFIVRIENVARALPSSISSGVFVTHTERDPFFTEGEPDRKLGLETLAEDGDPSALAANEMLVSSELPPGSTLELMVPADPQEPRLSFVARVMDSNDVFVAPDGEGIPLFNEAGRPLPERDVTSLVHLWNAGTEVDQAPGQGPMQSGAASAAEGVIRLFDASTRALPLARDIVDVHIEDTNGNLVLTVENISRARGIVPTALSPIVWGTHDGSQTLFTEGSEERAPGLEQLAEDADPSTLTRAGLSATSALVPDESAVIAFTPHASTPFLGLFVSIAESNDAFIALDGDVELFDAEGNLRDADTIESEIRSRLIVWDAGTEANEVPGTGVHQRARQLGPASGEPDPDPRVRRYRDATNDFAGPRAGGFLDVTIAHQGGTTFEVHIVNTSGGTPNQGLLTSFVWAVHDERVRVIDPGTRATPGLETLAEDCQTNDLLAEIIATPGVLAAESTLVPDGRTELGPLLPGYSYTFQVTADQAHRFFSIASMPFPTNDAVVGFGAPGIALLHEDGGARSDAEIADDVAAQLAAWDVGTEANQAGAAGRDQSPRQESHDAGVAEGNGTVRREADPIWSYPQVREIVRVTIVPVP